ncbi:MAG: tRNA lysidine(34) synthetase TilS [Deltaproteobacteria bacterium]
MGVSGGADSIALLHILNELSDYRPRIIVAHLNHGIRGNEAERDSEFVGRIADSLNLQFEYGEADTPVYKEKSKLSLEEAARALRYEFFHKVREKHRASKIATAHTLDDQAETVLMRLIRGSGRPGLSGIPPVSKPHIIRPLIDTSRSMVEEYLRSRGIPWIEDSTNELRTLLRNRIRLDLIPELKNYNPQIKETLARTSDILRLEDDYIKREGEKHFKRIFSKDEKELTGKLEKYKRLHAALRMSVLRLALDHTASLKNVSSVHLISADEFLTSAAPSGEVSFPGGIAVAKGYDYFLVTSQSGLKREFSHTIPSTGKWSFPELEVEIEKARAESLAEESENLVYLAREAVEFPIEVRSFKPGDRFIPLGMKNRKKLKNYFIDCKIPRFLRYRIPVFTSNGEIMWLGGLRIDERFKLKNKGKEALRFKLTRPRLFPG